MWEAVFGLESGSAVGLAMVPSLFGMNLETARLMGGCLLHGRGIRIWKQAVCECRLTDWCQTMMNRNRKMDGWRHADSRVRVVSELEADLDAKKEADGDGTGC